jgi:hypothetical protein
MWYNKTIEREVIKMIRCPNCGSTAQVKKFGNPYWSDNEEYISQDFKCDCGCMFERMYAVDEPAFVEIHYIEGDVGEEKFHY